jgi:hypothetical protein
VVTINVTYMCCLLGAISTVSIGRKCVQVGLLVMDCNGSCSVCCQWEQHREWFTEMCSTDLYQ